ncbi:MAG: hypothetical protein K2N87_12695 [Eubacterium sp.]|nr:hypothetical protein [Eubacterium sp.]
MKKIKAFWESLDDLATVSKRELFLEVVCCALAGFVLGMLLCPKKTTVIGSHNGNGRYEPDEEEDFAE